MYMNKLAAGPAVKHVVDIRNTPQQNIEAIARELHNGRVQDVSVAILDRPRHADLVQQVRRGHPTPSATNPLPHDP